MNEAQQNLLGMHQCMVATMIELLELFAVFFKIGLFTFGGGLAMLPLLERELTSKRSWASSEELLDYYAIAQSTPGIIAVNVATFIGFKRKKIIGGIVATAGMVTPSLIIITIIAEFISNFEDIVWVQKALAGINVAVAALLTYSVFTFAKKTIKTWWSFLLYAASFSAVYFFHVHTVIVILSAALVGILIALVTGKLKKDERESA